VLRGRNWRLLEQEGEAKEGRFRVRAFSTEPRRHGVLTVDFAKLVTEPKQFAVFEFDDGNAIPAHRLRLPKDLVAFVTKRFQDEGVPLVFSFCDTPEVVSVAMLYGNSVGFDDYTKAVTAMAIADAMRLDQSALCWDLSWCAGISGTELGVAERHVRCALLGTVLLVAVCDGALGLADGVDKITVDFLRGEAEPAIARLRKCADAFAAVRKLVGKDDWFDFDDD
jgi:hypothetical protein